MICRTIVHYLEAAERGDSPDAEALADCQPEFREFLRAHQWLEELTAPLRRLARENADRLSG